MLSDGRGPRSVRENRRSEPLEISDRPGINFQPKIACDGRDTIWDVWNAVRRNRWCILARAVSDGGMGPLVRLNEHTSEEAFPNITADGQGRIWVNVK